MANYKKAQTKAQTRVEMLDRLLAEMDPEVLLAGLLGATAAAGGLTPPLTRLLQTFNEALTGEGNDYAKVFLSMTGPGFVYTQATSLIEIITGTGGDEKTSAPDKIKLYGLMASGALEGMIMMNLVKNKEFMNQVLGVGKSLGAAAITAAGEAVPF